MTMLDRTHSNRPRSKSLPRVAYAVTRCGGLTSKRLRVQRVGPQHTTSVRSAYRHPAPRLASRVVHWLEYLPLIRSPIRFRVSAVANRVFTRVVRAVGQNHPHRPLILRLPLRPILNLCQLRPILLLHQHQSHQLLQQYPHQGMSPKAKRSTLSMHLAPKSSASLMGKRCGSSNPIKMEQAGSKYPTTKGNQDWFLRPTSPCSFRKRQPKRCKLQLESVRPRYGHCTTLTLVIQMSYRSKLDR